MLTCSELFSDSVRDSLRSRPGGFAVLPLGAIGNENEDLYHGFLVFSF